MMPPYKDRKGLLYNFYFWWLIIVGIIMTGILGNYWAELTAGLTVIILGWATYKIRKKWFYSIEELCDLQFINRDKIGNSYFRKALNIAPSKNIQNVPIFLSSNNTKTIYGLNISFGVKKPYSQKLKTILVNRLRQKRLITAPSPYWWGDFRTPVLEIKTHQPKIKRLIEIYFTDGEGISQPVIVDQSFSYNNEYHIVFGEPIKIPLGIPRGRILQINLELEMGNEWNGMIKFASNVDVSKLFVIRKVNISRKYEVSK